MRRSTTTLVSAAGIARNAVVIACAVLSVATVPMSFVFTKPAYADEFDDRIAKIQKQVDNYQDQANKLNARANDLQIKLDQFTAQKNAIQATIDLTQAKYDALQKKISDNEKRIATNKDTLGDALADMYVDGGTSPLEMLASSDSIGKFMNKQEYLSSIRDTLKATIDDIKNTQKELENQKKQVKRVLLDQKNARNALAQKEKEQADLVSQTRGESSTYAQLAESQKAEKLRVQQQQQDAIANRLRKSGRKSSLVAGGSLTNYASWVGDCYVDSNALSHSNDPLGYGCNQCVSYAAYMMLTKTNYGPSYWGNANMWPAKARDAGYQVSPIPRTNSLGVMYDGVYGHIVYVENYDAASGTVNISQYNEFIEGQGWGKFSRRYNVKASTYDQYIYL